MHITMRCVLYAYYACMLHIVSEFSVLSVYLYIAIAHLQL